MKIRMQCAKCHSENVSRDASAKWDEDAQEWSLAAVYDAAACDDCGNSRATIEEVPLSPASNDEAKRDAGS